MFFQISINRFSNFCLVFLTLPPGPNEIHLEERFCCSKTQMNFCVERQAVSEPFPRSN